MIAIALVFLAAAVAGGAILAIVHFSGPNNPPTPLAVIHGIAAVVGVGTVAGAIVLGFHTSVVTTEIAVTALAIFVVAALGGLLLFSQQMRGKRLSSPVVLLHGALGATGFLVLLLGALLS
jgi:hypothetical protein